MVTTHSPEALATITGYHALTRAILHIKDAAPLDEAIVEAHDRLLRDMQRAAGRIEADRAHHQIMRAWIEAFVPPNDVDEPREFDIDDAYDRFLVKIRAVRR
jgi:hypothetical protein